MASSSAVESIGRPAGNDVARPEGAARQRRRRRWIAALGAVVALAAITVAVRRLRVAAPTVARSALWIDEVRRGPMVRQIQGQGTLAPIEIRWSTATEAGRVERIHKRPGQAVSAGEILVELENPDLRLQALEAERALSESQSELVHLEATLESQRLAQESVVVGVATELGEARSRAVADDKLAGRGYLSSLEQGHSRATADERAVRLDIEKRRLAALGRGLQAQVAAQRTRGGRLAEIARFRHTQLDNLKVRATALGVLSDLPLEVGQWVVPGTVLAKVAQVDRLKAVVRIPESQARELTLQQTASVDTHNGVVAGHVARIDPAVQGGIVKVEVALDGALPAGARPDLTIEGTIEIERLADALYVGRPALAQARGRVTLFRLSPDGSEAVRTSVELGRSSARTIEIARGLRAGDRVVLSDMSTWDTVDRVQIQ